MTPVFAILESPVQLMVVAFIALMVFGNRLPEVMRSLGKGMSEFKKGMSGLENEFTRPSYASTYNEPQRALPAEPRPEINSAKLLPPTSAEVGAQSATPA
jgi:sec-independent protein translocase protein TatA